MKMTKEIKPKYRFNEERHIHQILVDGEYRNLTGCTTILGIVAKPALIQWSANMAVGYVKDKWGTNGLTSKELFEVLDEAKTAHRRRKESAGEYGTMVHDTVSEIIQDAIDNCDGYVRSGKNPNKSIQNFLDWAITKNVKFLATEKNIYSERYFIGGIVDFVCEIDGQVFVGDIKTAKSGIYPENFWQCAGYDIMMKDMGLSWANDIKGYVILNLKENGEFLEKRSISNGDNTKAFLACLEIYRIKEKINNQVI